VNLDTSFLIDLHRELGGKSPNGARAFLQAHAATRFQVSVVAAMEFWEGFANPAVGNRCLAPFHQIPFDAQMARLASRIRRSLRGTGSLIGDLDIQIAATALHMGEPLVTSNIAHFQRVPGLACVPYRT